MEKFKLPGVKMNIEKLTHLFLFVDNYHMDYKEKGCQNGTWVKCLHA